MVEESKEFDLFSNQVSANPAWLLDNRKSSYTDNPKSKKKQPMTAEVQYSEERYRNLLDTFNLQSKVVAASESTAFIVDKIRNIAEFLIFAQRNQNSNYFDDFVEEGILQKHFSRLLAQKNRLIQIQIIQTVAILVQNIQERAHLFYLLGNPFITELI